MGVQHPNNNSAQSTGRYDLKVRATISKDKGKREIIELDKTAFLGICTCQSAVCFLRDGQHEGDDCGLIIISFNTQVDWRLISSMSGVWRETLPLELISRM